MKILFIISNLKIGGGAEKSVMLLTKELKKYYDVELLTFYDFKEEYFYDVKRHSFNFNYSESLINKVKNLLFLFPLKLRNFLKKNKYDLVISNAEDANVVSILCKKYFYNYKLWTVIRNDIFGKKHPYHKFNFLQRYADKRIVLTKALQQRTEFDTTVIENATELDEINNKKYKGIIKEKDLFEKKTILMVGRLAPQKNYKWFIQEVFNKLSMDINLLILGTGPLEQELKELTKNNKNIHFLGVKENPYMYMNKADVFVLPSLFEGMPRVLMEALACGCVCVANDCETGPRELLNVPLNKELKTYTKTEYGYLVPFNNKEEFKKALINALKHGKKIQPDTRFELENITEKWVREIEKN